MTAAERNQLRNLIDQEKRRRLQAAKPKDRRKSADTRRASYRAYYHRNRERILAARRVAITPTEA